MSDGADRREARRFTMSLPMRVLSPVAEARELGAETRDVSYRGLYFLADAKLKIGSEIDFVITLPEQVTQSSDVNIRCQGQIVRVEPTENGRVGIAARIDRYDVKLALEDLQEEALLPHPVKLRDMILRHKLGPQDAQVLNHDFQDYLTRFGELQKVARGILEKLAAGQRKAS